jgi:hypothetical protein
MGPRASRELSIRRPGISKDRNAKKKKRGSREIEKCTRSILLKARKRCCKLPNSNTTEGNRLIWFRDKSNVCNCERLLRRIIVSKVFLRKRSSLNSPRCNNTSGNCCKPMSSAINTRSEGANASSSCGRVRSGLVEMSSDTIPEVKGGSCSNPRPASTVISLSRAPSRRASSKRRSPLPSPVVKERWFSK